MLGIASGWSSWRTMAWMTLMLAGCATMHKADPDTPMPRGTATGAARWSFDKDQANRIPNGWSVRQTNPTESLATWEVIADKSAPSRPNVMALTASNNYNGTYNLAIAEDSSFQNLDLTVRVKAAKGEEDQGGGPIWRCKDQDNYYICRFNPLESNYRVYKVVDGRRRQLDSAKIELHADCWYRLRVTMVGNRITCYLNGREMLEATDDTLSGPGMVGLWTKADAVTSFDDLEVSPLDEH
ncbi:MAG: DUF1080 domain-containing protein [Phycisphaerales bacterium]|nr:MAG: DUF1080 domain-containing protein [Phycisphaerales bacterium]